VDSPLLVAPAPGQPLRYLLLRRRLGRLLRTLSVGPDAGVDAIIAALARHLGGRIDVDGYPFRVPGFFGGHASTTQ
jgi:hypothetical protein